MIVLMEMNGLDQLIFNVLYMSVSHSPVAKSINQDLWLASFNVTFVYS